MMRNKGQVLIPSIAYGDAAGLPVETRSAEYIQQHYGIIASLLPSHENPFFGGEHDPGMWSDDTQLSIAVTNALIKANGFDINAMAESHIIAYDATPEINRNGKMVKRGWGGSTVNAMEKIKAGISPAESGTLDGTGNGVLMKMAPLAYWHAAQNVSDEERYAQYDALTTMTHDSPVTRLTTRIHGDVLHNLIKNGYEREQFLEKLTRSVTYHEALTEAGTEMSELLSYLNTLENRGDVLRMTDAKGFYAPQTLAMAYGAFILNAAQYTRSVYEAVNLGGDTDSTGSIVAAMSVFAAQEGVRIPIDHQGLDQLQMLKRVSRELAEKALGSVKAT